MIFKDVLQHVEARNNKDDKEYVMIDFNVTNGG